MATPLLDTYIDSLYDFSGNTIASLIRKFLKEENTILDIGAGWGKYRWLLPEYTMDAVEIYESEIINNNLNKYYRNVYNINIIDFNINEFYGASIFGDVLEHLSIEDAQYALENMIKKSKYIFVTVPYEMKQNAVDDKIYEIHIQDDLTDKIMRSRYPKLKLVEKNEKTGIYMYGES